MTLAYMRKGSDQLHRPSEQLSKQVCWLACRLGLQQMGCSAVRMPSAAACFITLSKQMMPCKPLFQPTASPAARVASAAC